MAPKKTNLKGPLFNDDDAAREHLESLLWPASRICSRCGMGSERIAKLEGKSTRAMAHTRPCCG